MKISVFGLGYVGSVSAGCLAKLGHEIVGVDRIAEKVRLINRGQPPVVEKDLGGLIGEAVGQGRLIATQDADKAIAETDLSFVCVGTPSAATGDLDLSHVLAATGEIGLALRKKRGRHCVVTRSTVLPGSVRGMIIPRLEQASGKRAGVDFDVAHNPEFMRESVAVADFYAPPKTVVGSDDAAAVAQIAELYAGITAPFFATSIEESETIKYADNAWHALKVAFANEIGTFCKASGIDGRKIMEIFCRDSKLNISPAYLEPGFAFGGSCLPKDLRALAARGRSLGLDLPVINAVLPSNARQLQRGVDLVRSLGKRRVGLLGLCFKAGTDDMRESPLLELVSRLLDDGYDVRVFDRHATLAALVGANREFLLERIPNIAEVVVGSIAEILDHADTLVVGNRDPEFLRIGARPGQAIVDLVGMVPDGDLDGRYHGINW